MNKYKKTVAICALILSFMFGYVIYSVAHKPILTAAVDNQINTRGAIKEHNVDPNLRTKTQTPIGVSVPREVVHQNQGEVEIKDLSDPKVLEAYKNTAFKNIEKYQAYFKRDPYFNFDQFKQDNFKKEPVNPNWASAREIQLQKLFANSKALQSSNLKSIECRSKFCRIEVFFNDPGEIETITSSLAQGFDDSNMKKLFLGGGDYSYSQEHKIVSAYLTDDPNATLLTDEIKE